jgi:mono/diheme cytochrome c family protein
MIQAEGENSYIGKVFVKYSRVVMPPFTLTDDEIKQILRYVEAQPAP